MVILIADLRALADARLKDAYVLYENERTDGAGYICGYAIELALKARICSTLHWLGFPATPAEFKSFRSFKTHELDILLALSGQEQRVRTEHLKEWSFVANWDPEVRYRTVGKPEFEVVMMLISAKTLLEVL